MSRTGRRAVTGIGRADSGGVRAGGGGAATRRQPSASRRRSLRGAIVGVGDPARRLSLTAPAGGGRRAIAAIAAAAAIATASGSPGGATSGARLTGEVGPDNAASSPSLAWAYAAPAAIGGGHVVVARLPGRGNAAGALGRGPPGLPGRGRRLR